MSETLKRKLSSRKFWMSVAAFLGSVGVGISGIATGEKWVVIAGVICSAISAAIYTAFEAHIDAAHIKDGE